MGSSLERASHIHIILSWCRYNTRAGGSCNLFKLAVRIHLLAVVVIRERHKIKGIKVKPEIYYAFIQLTNILAIFSVILILV